MAGDFASDSPFLQGAYQMARDSHHGSRRESDTDIDHPVKVAHLLSDTGFDERTVAAALLHDVVEDTATDTNEIAERFGPEVARLVAEMTEDTGIEPYEDRKAEHRSRVSRDRDVAAIYAADKLAGARDMLDDPGSVPGAQLDHYIQSLVKLRHTHPDLPFLGPLERELGRIREARRPGD